MALETLKNVKEIMGVKIVEVETEGDIKNSVNFIEVNHKTNSIKFQIQDGPIKENGENGCQVTDMIATARYIIEKLNSKFPCHENHQTIRHLRMALGWQERRTSNRIKRDVEGTSNA